MDKKPQLIFLLLILSCLLILNGCMSTHKKDGPPRFNVNVQHIPDATPRVEALSRYGNKPSYVVFGRKYHVMSSSRHYEEQGIASWYGTMFDQHLTSSGERYNMLGMTAAHKSLPLPTYVQVTNLANGRKVIVKVNDRGPFAPNRIIDLSYVAAKKLGMLGHGTALVNVKAIDPLESANHIDILAQNKSHTHLRVAHQSRTLPTFYLQVGAFKNKFNAAQLQKKLAQVTFIPVKINHQAPLYLVRIGPIRDADAAGHINRRLQAMGLQTKKIPGNYDFT